MNKPLQTAYAPQGEAEQRIYTPLVLAEKLILKLWPGGIAYDPFPGVGAPISEMARRCCRGDGFVEPLVSESFANPPFKRLQEAMRKFFDHGAEHPDDGLLLLGPAATNRTWFWSCAGDMIAWLKPITFVGFSSTFPKALALHYYGAEQLRFRDVCRDSGLVVRVSCSRSERL